MREKHAAGVLLVPTGKRAENEDEDEDREAGIDTGNERLT